MQLCSMHNIAAGLEAGSHTAVSRSTLRQAAAQRPTKRRLQSRPSKQSVQAQAPAVAERANVSDSLQNGASIPITRPRLSPASIATSVAAVVLAGGSSDNPLAQERALPSLELGSNLRLIDVPISNCIRSGINKLFVLTQWNSNALNQHIHNSFPPSTFGNARQRGFVDVLTANQTPRSTSWYRGSADAVRQNLENISDPFDGEPVEDLLILSGAGLYDLDYSEVLNQHRTTDADVTIVTHSIAADLARSRGLLKVDNETGMVRNFAEKPSKEAIEGGSWLRSSDDGNEAAPYEASMGIYLFKRTVLEALLNSNEKATVDTAVDVHFGYDVIPHALKEGYKVGTYHHDGFWQEVNSLKTFYDINIALAKPNAPLSVDAIHKGILSRGYFAPPAIVSHCELENTLVGDGSQLRRSNIKNTVLGRNCWIDVGCEISDSVIIGNSIYQNDAERQRLRKAGEPVPGLGKNVILKNTVLDMNVSLGNDVSITNMYGVAEADRAETGGFMIQDGIVTILANQVILDGTRI